MEHLPFYQKILSLVLGSLFTHWLCAKRWSAASRRVWVELARDTGLILTEANSKNGHPALTGTYRGRILLVDSGPRHSKSRITLKCSNPSGLFLSISTDTPVAAHTLDSELKLDSNRPGHSTAHAFRMPESILNAKVYETDFVQGFFIESNRKRDTVKPLLGIPFGFADRFAFDLRSDMRTLLIENGQILIALNWLPARRRDVQRLHNWFNLVSEVADVVEKMA